MRRPAPRIQQRERAERPPPASDGTPSAIAARRAPVTSAASAPAQTYTPATGLAHTAASDRTAAATGARRTHAHAAIANAMPTANGTRPTNRLATAAPANSQVASSAARGVVASRFATTLKHQTDATVARLPTRYVPSSACSGGETME